MSTAAPLQNTAVKPQPSSPLGCGGMLLQRQCACGAPTSSLTGECEECKSKTGLQRKLTIGASNDPLEQEADRVADQVLAAPFNSAVSGAPPRIQRFSGQSNEQMDAAPASVDRALANPGRPLEPALRQDMEQRFGHDFSRVRVHSGGAAEQSVRDVNANAYTVGHTVVFGEGRFAPGTHEGRRLIAHELTHVIQQGSQEGYLSAQPRTVTPEKPAEKPEKPTTSTTPTTGSGPAPSCATNPGCPPEFCTPFATRQEALDDRDVNAGSVLAGIPVSRTRPLFQEYISGGGPPRDISAGFAADFKNSLTTINIARLLVNRLEDSLKANPPTFPSGANAVTVNIKDVLNEGTINQILDKMVFDNPFEAPGLLAGGIGKTPTQSGCRVGAITSDQDDARLAEGTATVTKNTDGTLFISPAITFTVLDTIDFCPGACGQAGMGVSLTVPMSRWEASLISGDVPFTVRFPAPSLTGAVDSER